MKRFAQILMICAIAASLAACATGRWETRTLIDQRQLNVSLEQRIEENVVVDQGFSHPVDIAPVVIETFLGNLYYPEMAALFGAPREQPVFQAEEKGRLAPALSTALAEATPNQRIRFTSLNKGGGLIFKDRRETGGVVFVDASQRLNIAFSNINRVIEYDEGGRSTGTEQRDPLEIERTDTPVRVRAPYIGSLPDNDGETRPMWVAAGLEELKAAAAAEKKKPEPVPVPAPDADGGKADGISAPGSEPKAPAENPPVIDNQLRTKLAYLKELYEDGLISQAEYEAKKRELLEQIK